MTGMKQKSKAHQPQVYPSSSDADTSGATSSGSPSKLPRFPTSVLNRFQIKARRQRQQLKNMSISPTNRQFILFFGFFVLAGLHTVIVTTHLQKKSKMTGNANDASLQTPKVSAFAAPEKKSKESAPPHKSIDVEELEKSAEWRRAKAVKRIERMDNAELALLVTGDVITSTTNSTMRQLTLSDIGIGKFLGDGAINIVAMAVLPEWWYTQNKVNKKIQFVIKIAVGLNSDLLTKQAEREYEVIETLSRDKKKAKEFNIVQAIFMSRTIPNPFRKKKFPTNFPIHYRDPIRNAENVVVIIQPYLELDYIHDLVKFKDIRHFIRTLLQTLEYAHSLGINNFDLSDSNVRVGKHGEAVVMDWNANRRLGEDIYDSMANLWFTAPEGMIPYGPKRETIRLTSISAMDIWSVGIMLVFLMYEPCQWVNPDVPKMRNKNSLLREIVKSIGGETKIPIGDNQELDLAKRFGFVRENLLKKKWKMPLYDLEEDNMCDDKDTESYMVMYSAKNKELDDMYDFLRSMMKLSPAERANATTLLSHPFMDF
ncbi:unnamed protein product [Cylindrotheca closterium]|uniref:non-specific serine/threonine protein kinase n=1 Tax=Cylindrotheca closterium TaxID=2856 RepID=A0AAD2JLN9_9STRA|nr:unnamed protein product [Cylindrotheca closterium]